MAVLQDECDVGDTTYGSCCCKPLHSGSKYKFPNYIVLVFVLIALCQLGGKFLSGVFGVR